MKFLLQKDSQFYNNSYGKFVFVEGLLPEIDKGLLDKVRGDEKEDKEVTKRLQDAREKAINAFSTGAGFSPEIIDRINATSSIEAGSNPVEDLKNNTRDQILSVLDSTGTITSTPPEFHDLVENLRNTSNRVELTTLNVKSAMETLNNLRERYDIDVKVYEKNLDNDKRFASLWSHVTRQRERGSLQEEFIIKNSFVMGVFDELSKKLDDQNIDAEAIKKKNIKQIGERFKNLSTEDQAEFITHAQTEISGGGDLKSLLTNDAQLDVIQGITHSQRLEAFKELNFDNSGISKILETVNGNQSDNLKSYDDQANAVKHISPKFDILRRGVSVGINTDNLESLSGADDAKNKLKEIIPKLENYLTNQGTTNISDLFQNAGFQNNINLSNIDKFLVFAKYLGDNEDDAKALPNSLKKEVLAYLNFVESVDSSETAEEEFNSKFLTLESADISNTFIESKKIFDDLKLSGNLSSISFRKKKIDKYLSDNYAKTIYLIDNLKNSENLSSEEINILDDYKKKLNNIASKFREIKDKYEEELNNFDKNLDLYHNNLKEKRKWESIVVSTKKFENFETTDSKYKSTTTTKDGSSTTSSDGIHESLLEADKKGFQKWEEASAKVAEIGTLTEPKLTTSLIKIDISGDYVEDIAKITLEVDELKNITTKRSRTVETSAIRVKKALRYLREETAKIRNANLFNELETAREKQLTLITKSEIGSSFNFEYHDYQKHGLPPTANTILTGSTTSLNNCTLLEKSESGAVLLANDKLIFLQKSNSEKGEIVMIAVPAPAGVAQDGVPKDFDPGRNYSFIGAPMSVTC